MKFLCLVALLQNNDRFNPQMSESDPQLHPQLHLQLQKMLKMNLTATELPTLQIGAQGVAVKSLQHLLNQRVNRNYIVAVDGVFGAKTKQAVAVFQYSKLLRRDGIVGAKTWRSLETSMPAVLPIIRRGSKGEAVSIAQAVLKESGLYLGFVNGDFGLPTETAVRSFQAHQNLIADGVVGNQTWLALSNVATYLAFD